MKESIEKKRAVALDWALNVSRLLDERYFSRAQDALVKGEKGEAAFRSVCLEAGMAEDMIEPLWNSLIRGVQTKVIWAPFIIPIKKPPYEGPPHGGPPHG
jgi:hypothetical protein